jgi:hypothetical protein
MLSHALTIVVNELTEHLKRYNDAQPPQVGVGNLAEGVGNVGANVPRDRLNLSVVNLKEEKALKNVPAYVRNDVTLKATYENPPAFLNFLILATATHANYSDGLLVLSRAIRFFQSQSVFTQDNVLPNSITMNGPANPLDRLSEFKLIFDLYSPSMEEVNYLWGTLGGKQYPSVLYVMRMLDLKFSAVQSESGLITDVITDYYHKSPVTNSNG